MSYGFCRKQFQCTFCEPPRIIKMLVQSDTPSVVCDQCRNQAPALVKTQSNASPNIITQKGFEEHKVPESNNQDWPNTKLRRMNFSETSNELINPTQTPLQAQKMKSSPGQINSSSKASGGLSRSNLADGAYNMVFSEKKKSSKANDLQQSRDTSGMHQIYHTRVNPRDRSLDNFHGDAGTIKSPSQISSKNISQSTKTSSNANNQNHTYARNDSNQIDSSSFAGIRPGFLNDINSRPMSKGNGRPGSRGFARPGSRGGPSQRANRFQNISQQSSAANQRDNVIPKEQRDNSTAGMSAIEILRSKSKGPIQQTAPQQDQPHHASRPQNNQTNNFPSTSSQNVAEQIINASQRTSNRPVGTSSQNQRQPTATRSRRFGQQSSQQSQSNTQSNKWQRPKPKNGNGNARRHWDDLHRLRPVGVRYSSMGPQVSRNADNGAMENDPIYRAFMNRHRQNREQQAQGSNANPAAESGNPGAQPNQNQQTSTNGIRARSTQVRHQDGSVSQVINIGVPSNHPLADRERQPGTTGLYNINMNGMRFAAPEFVINVVRDQNNNNSSNGQQNGSQANNGDDQTRVQMTIQQNGQGFRPNERNNGRMGGQEPTAQEQLQINNQVDRITHAIIQFHNLFSTHQFLRMQQTMNGAAPNDFMSNFNQSFNPNDDIFEMVRRLSEQEAERQRKKNKASQEAVDKLPIIKIEEQHCKSMPMQPGGLRKQKFDKKNLEPPTCTVCCEHIQLGKKGMFMPCGHIYHPDCLKPWLQNNNSCPVCRFELPKEGESQQENTQNMQV